MRGVMQVAKCMQASVQNDINSQVQIVEAQRCIHERGMGLRKEA